MATSTAPAVGGTDTDRVVDDLATSMIDLLHRYAGIKARVSGPQADANPVFLLAKLVHFGPRRSGELATDLCTDPSTVSRQVATLVKQGLVERQADPEDGRASLLVPTAAGIERVDRHRRRRGQAIAPIVADWAAEDVSTLLELLRRYVAGLDEHRDVIVANMAGHQVSAAEHEQGDH
jgi:DNA-binding MarR family transcriptional regulator